MTLMHLFLIHRYQSTSVHYLSPTEDNQNQTARMAELGIYSRVASEVGDIIVADVDADGVAALLQEDGRGVQALIRKQKPRVRAVAQPAACSPSAS